VGRPKKDGVDYFSHDINATGGRTIFTLESKYGNDGYAFWFKLLEILGAQSSLSYDCSDYSNWSFLVAKTKVSEEKAAEILDTLSQLEAIDKELWSEKVIWVEKFSERLDDVFRKRGTETPEKPSFCHRNTEECVQSVTESTQSKGKERKGKDSIVECMVLSAPKIKFQKPTIEEIREYCQERRNRIVAERFYDWNESKGWKVGNQAMKDWKAAVRTWEAKDLNNSQSKPMTDAERIMSQ
jgi:hypothetical protein